MECPRPCKDLATESIVSREIENVTFAKQCRLKSNFSGLPRGDRRTFQVTLIKNFSFRIFFSRQGKCYNPPTEVDLIEVRIEIFIGHRQRPIKITGEFFFFYLYRRPDF